LHDKLIVSSVLRRLEWLLPPDVIHFGSANDRLYYVFEIHDM
jgi:hypothetical protein